jgi:hypothetical protein
VTAYPKIPVCFDTIVLYEQKIDFPQFDFFMTAVSCASISVFLSVRFLFATV